MQQEFVEVRLLGVPASLRSESWAQAEDLMRELTLLRLSVESRGSHAPVPAELLDFGLQLLTCYTPFHSPTDTELNSTPATDHEDEQLDVLYRMPLTIARDVIAQLFALLLQGDYYCRSDYLLTLPASDLVVAYRTWVIEEFDRQTQGQPARIWEAPVIAPLGNRRVAPLSPKAKSVISLAQANLVRHARQQVRQTLLEMGLETLVDNAELGVSELVTNTMIHAQTDFTVTVGTTEQGNVRIGVRDFSESSARLRPGQVDNCTGRGIRMVHSISTRWGIDAVDPAEGPGKTIWFEPRGQVDDTGFSSDEWAADIEELMRSA